MKKDIEEKYALVVELLQETIDGLEGGNVPFEFIANLDIVIEIIEEIHTAIIYDEIESEQQLDDVSHIEYDIIN